MRLSLWYGRRSELGLDRGPCTYSPESSNLYILPLPYQQGIDRRSLLSIQQSRIQQLFLQLFLQLRLRQGLRT